MSLLWPVMTLIDAYTYDSLDTWYNHAANAVLFLANALSLTNPLFFKPKSSFTFVDITASKYWESHLKFGTWIGYKKILWIFFQKYGFIRKIEPFHLRMKHNIIQMTATSDLTVRHSINPIFQYIFDCLGFNPMNGNFDFVFQGLNRLCMVSVTLILNGSSKKK